MPTDETVAEMAVYIKLFRSRGGRVLLPPHLVADRQRWIVEAKRYREEWDYLPALQRTDRLKSGLSYLWAAVRKWPRCIVALRVNELVAALSFDLRVDRIEVHVIGSRQADEASGAGMAIEFALAEEALRRQLPVFSGYTGDAENWHKRLGRRLNLVAGENSSEWTLEDCEFIVRGIKGLL